MRAGPGTTGWVKRCHFYTVKFISEINTTLDLSKRSELQCILFSPCRKVKFLLMLSSPSGLKAGYFLVNCLLHTDCQGPKWAIVSSSNLMWEVLNPFFEAAFCREWRSPDDVQFLTAKKNQIMKTSFPSVWAFLVDFRSKEYIHMNIFPIKV